MKTVFIVLLVVGIVSLLVFSIGKNPIQNTYDTSDNKQSLSDKNLTILINEWRVQEGHKPYIEDKRLCSFADIRVKEIQVYESHDGFFNHTNKGEYKDFRELGENLIYNFNTEVEALKAWVDSPEHLENLVKDFKYSCVRCQDLDCVQIFGNK